MPEPEAAHAPVPACLTPRDDARLFRWCLVVSLFCLIAAAVVFCLTPLRH